MVLLDSLIFFRVKTLAIQHPEALPPIAVDEPTISMEFIANNGPFSGLDGDHVTSIEKLRERLYKELQSNVALRVEDANSREVFKVSRTW